MQVEQRESSESTVQCSKQHRQRRIKRKSKKTTAKNNLDIQPISTACLPMSLNQRCWSQDTCPILARQGNAKSGMKPRPLLAHPPQTWTLSRTYLVKHRRTNHPQRREVAAGHSGHDRAPALKSPQYGARRFTHWLLGNHSRAQQGKRKRARQRPIGVSGRQIVLGAPGITPYCVCSLSRARLLSCYSCSTHVVYRIDGLETHCKQLGAIHAMYEYAVIGIASLSCLLLSFPS